MAVIYQGFIDCPYRYETINFSKEVQAKEDAQLLHINILINTVMCYVFIASLEVQTHLKNGKYK